MKKSVSKGFTLIELLVVIAIIGILASIVLVNLNTARDKGRDAKLKAEVANARAQAELYYDTNNNYDGVCAAAGTAGGLAGIVSSLGADSAGCGDATTGWALGSNLSNGDIFCADSTGFAGTSTDAVEETDDACAD